MLYVNDGGGSAGTFSGASYSGPGSTPRPGSSSGGGVAPGASHSQSTSSSFIPTYAESPFLQSIAQYAGTVGQNVYNWAQGEYAKNSNLTDANIHNYLTTSAQSLGMAQNDLSRYENKFQPEEDQLLRDANEYASPSRKLMAMGAAESGQAQAGEAARKNAERDLQSYGIDPSSGRYEALDRAALVSAGAAEAGAAQQAAQHTEDVGRDLRQQAIAVGGQYPGRISNSMNTALQGFAGAENAGLANANTGVALQGAANPFLTTASSLKYPPLGNASASSSDSQAFPPSAGGGGGGGSSGGGSKSPTSGGGGGGLGDSGSAVSPGMGGSVGGSSSSWSDAPTSSGSGGGISSGGIGDYSGGGDPSGGLSGGGWGGDPYTGGSGGDNLSGGGWGGDPYTQGGSSPDPFAAGGDNYAGDYTPPSDTYDMGGAYAEGGAIPEDDTGGIQEDGGSVPQSASPSGGQVVDDVRAQSPHGAINVNADEFVIPRDVALWKGQEFFQKLITQSRQARVMAPAHPSRGAPAPAQNMM